MLDVKALKTNIEDAVKASLPNAIEDAVLEMWPSLSDTNNDRAKKLGESIANAFAPNFAETLSSIIDAYIKTAEIVGTISTVGGPTAQFAQLLPINMGNPMAGSIPNTLKIQ